MKVVGFNGSPRERGNTFTAIQTVFDQLQKEGIETELIHIGENPAYGCTDCGICKKTKDGFCSIDSDGLNENLEKIYSAEGMVIGSPVYFGSITPATKAFIERVGYCARAGGPTLKRKVCASVAAVRRQGAVDTLNQINNMFFLNEAIMPFSSYWNFGFGREKGEIKGDDEGMKTFTVLGENMAWLLKKVND